jgi:hypothetical protein
VLVVSRALPSADPAGGRRREISMNCARAIDGSPAFTASAGSQIEERGRDRGVAGGLAWPIVCGRGGSDPM